MEAANKITLDIYRPDDVEPMYDILKQEIYYQNLLHLPKKYEIQHAHDWVNARLQAQANGDNLTKKVIRFNNSFVGGIGHLGESENDLKKHRTEIGYFISDRFWNMGFATQAITQYCKLLFKELPLQKIVATVFSHNLASARALEKSGFAKEATFLKHFYREGKYLDCHVYSLYNEQITSNE